MTTTIQVSDSTKQVLESLKVKESAASYDELIRHLVDKHSKIPKSMFGSIKTSKWKKEDRFDFHEL